MINVKLQQTNEFPLEPLEWSPCHESTRSRFKATMCCSNGHVLVLKGHEVSAEGKVSPSVVCLEPSCDFHEFVKLEEWPYGDL